MPSSTSEPYSIVPPTTVSRDHTANDSNETQSSDDKENQKTTFFSNLDLNDMLATSDTTKDSTLSLFELATIPLINHYKSVPVASAEISSCSVLLSGETSSSILALSTQPSSVPTLHSSSVLSN